MALALKGIDYQYKAVNLLKSEQLDEQYKGKINKIESQVLANIFS